MIVERNDWDEIAFDNLEAIDLPAALNRFDLKRNMTKTGIFRAIEPHERTE